MPWPGWTPGVQFEDQSLNSSLTLGQSQGEQGVKQGAPRLLRCVHPSSCFFLYSFPGICGLTVTLRGSMSLQALYLCSTLRLRFSYLYLYHLSRSLPFLIEQEVYLTEP